MFTHVVLDGVTEGALGVGLDVVDAARRLTEARLVVGEGDPRALKQRVASIDGVPVRSGTGREIAVDSTLSLRGARAGDVWVVPGLSAVSEPAIDALLGRDDTARVAALLARAVDKGVLVAASCSATFVLAAAGLLNGRRATTTWWLAPLLSRRFVDVDVVADQMVVQSTGVWTAGSAFAHADLMLGLMSHVAGPSLAHLVARYLVLDERVTQTRYMVMEHLRTADEAVRAVERFVVDNLHRQVTLAELAQVAKMSPRTLSRRIEHALAMTPLEFVQRQRVARAAHLLDTTNASVDDVANRVGYADAAAFRRVFRRFTGTAPRDGRGAR